MWKKLKQRIKLNSAENTAEKLPNIEDKYKPKPSEEIGNLPKESSVRSIPSSHFLPSSKNIGPGSSNSNSKSLFANYIRPESLGVLY